MSLTPELARWLQGDEATPYLQTLSAEPPGDEQLIGALTRLRRHFTPAQAAALVTTARLRQKAEAKFGDDARAMLFSDELLQQASSALVSAHTAKRFARFARVGDWGCGLGGDSLSLARTGAQVAAVDVDELAITLTQANARALDLEHAIFPVRANVQMPAWRVEAAWADPGRRTDARRLFDPEQLHPPLSAVLAQLAHTPNLGIKLMPGLSHDAIPPAAEAEWISLNGDLKECVLWFGEIAEPGVRRATILPAGGEIIAVGVRAAVREPGAYFYEPDDAVLRAGAVGDLAGMFGLWQIDAEIAYLSGDAQIATPFARSWRVIEHMPFNLKTLNRSLRALGGRVTAVKKRGSAVEPEAFRRRLHNEPQGRELVVFLTRVADKPWMLLCEERTPDSL
ncbi:MAG: methyltransferase [Caldilineales bacterium]|nr:methyltransferase [Caldilineales bacterium]